MHTTEPQPDRPHGRNASRRYEHIHFRLLRVCAGVTLLLAAVVAFIGSMVTGLHPRLLTGAALLLAASLLFSMAGAAVHRSRDRRATLMVTAGILAFVTSQFLVTPGSAAHIALLPVLLMALIATQVHGRRLLWALMAAAAASALLLVANALWASPRLLPVGLDLAIRLVGYLTLLALAVGLLARNQRLLRWDLADARVERHSLIQANAQVQETLQSLERSRERLETSDQSLLEARDHLHRSNRAIMRFLNSAAHELRTPLAPALMQLDILRDNPAVGNDRRMRASLGVIERNLTRLKDTVDDLVDVARMRAEQISFVASPTPLHELMQEVQANFEAAAAARGTALQIEAPRITVMADRDRILQVLFSLVSNALQATGKGDTIWVQSRIAGEVCLVRVIDSGRGLTPEEAERIFEPFTNPQGVESAGRAGLGLYISRSIIEGHGGYIACNSPGPGKGAMFRFTLPLAKESDAESARESGAQDAPITSQRQTRGQRPL